MKEERYKITFVAKNKVSMEVRMILENKDINSYEVTDLTSLEKARAC